MELQIAIMKNAAELETTQPFVIDSFLWGTESIPRTYGYLGYVPDDGFYLKMVCEEENPLRTYTEYQSPVCLDSAMEAFLMFGGGERSGTGLSESGGQRQWRAAGRVWYRTKWQDPIFQRRGGGVWLPDRHPGRSVDVVPASAACCP